MLDATTAPAALEPAAHPAPINGGVLVQAARQVRHEWSVRGRVEGAESALRAAAGAGVRKVVLTSSTVTLPPGKPGAPAATESEPCLAASVRSPARQSAAPHRCDHSHSLRKGKRTIALGLKRPCAELTSENSIPRHARSPQRRGKLPHMMTDEDSKRVRETVLAELRRRRILAKRDQDHRSTDDADDGEAIADGGDWPATAPPHSAAMRAGTSASAKRAL